MQHIEATGHDQRGAHRRPGIGKFAEGDVSGDARREQAGITERCHDRDIDAAERQRNQIDRETKKHRGAREQQALAQRHRPPLLAEADAKSHQRKRDHAGEGEYSRRNAGIDTSGRYISESAREGRYEGDEGPNVERCRRRSDDEQHADKTDQDCGPATSVLRGRHHHDRRALAALAILAWLTHPAAAQDKVKVGVFPVSSTLPYFVALERGFFKEQNIEPEMVRLIGGPPNVAAMITNQIDAAAVLVTIEGMNADLKKPGVAMYISGNSQNKTYQMEQFVVRKGFKATTLKDLKGAKIMSAPAPANVTMAKAALTAVCLKDGDDTLDQIDMGQHVTVVQAGTVHRGDAIRLESN